MRLEPNPNKHIHIPQYVVMTWLLLAALSRDYKGKGLLLLIFICASLLGVVDELEQGIHPARFYGWSDMLVNSSSAVIGVLTILGLKPPKEGDWSWKGYLKEHKALIGLGVFGLIGAGLMCYFLFRVQAAEVFRGVYPIWLLVWNWAYLILAVILVGSACAVKKPCLWLPRIRLPKRFPTQHEPPACGSTRCWRSSFTCMRCWSLCLSQVRCSGNLWTVAPAFLPGLVGQVST